MKRLASLVALAAVLVAGGFALNGPSQAAAQPMPSASPMPSSSPMPSMRP